MSQHNATPAAPGDSKVVFPRSVTITLSMKQAEAMLYAATIGDVSIRARGLPCGHKARDGAIRILDRTLANVKASR